MTRSRSHGFPRPPSFRNLRFLTRAKLAVFPRRGKPDFVITKSRVFLYFCLAFVGGILLNSFIFVPQLIMLGLLILGVLLISTLWPSPQRFASEPACYDSISGRPARVAMRAGHRKKFVVVGFCFLFLAAGIFRHQLAESKIIYSDEQNVTFIGVVVEEPDIRANNIKLTVETEKIEGKILVTANRYPEYQYGDKLKIIGKLQIPQEFEDFNYKEYLTKDGIYSVMYWPKIQLLEKNVGGLTSHIFGGVLRFKDGLRESIYRSLSPPQSSILGAMILGDKRRISDELKEKLNIAGVRHITAISGMHVAILTAILMGFLTGLGLWRRQAFYLTVFLIALFIIMTGLQSSAIRAGIMGGLFLLAQYLGRPHLSARTVVFAASFMLVQNPLLLRLDIGFQLSFLAVIGIIYLMPFFKRLVRFQILAMTLAAQVFTLPILIYNFGYFSLVAPVTNTLIVPLLPFVLGLGFVFGLAGMIFQPLGWVLSWPVWFLLTYIVKIVDWFSNFPVGLI